MVLALGLVAPALVPLDPVGAVLEVVIELAAVRVFAPLVVVLVLAWVEAVVPVAPVLVPV